MNSPFKKPLRGIIFDLDGTLYHMKWYMKALLMTFLFPRAMLLPRYMKIRKQFAGRDMQNGDELLNALAVRLSGRPDPVLSGPMRDWIEGPFYHGFTQIMPFLRGSRPSINEHLAKLKNKGYFLGVLSDFSHIRARLERLAINADVFDILLSSEEAGALKPSPRPFHQIAVSWGLAPEHILVIGDRTDTDGEGARQAGMQFQRITDEKNDLPDARHWSEFVRLFDTLPAIHR
jgi:FMN phosphatase YigB (HAD superfamily)